MKKIYKTLIVISGGIFINGIILLYNFQEKLIYMPTIPDLPQAPQNNPQGFRNPLEWKIQYEDVTIESQYEKCRLNGWFLKQPDSRNCNTVVFFHENAGNIGLRLEYLFYYYHRLKVNILIMAYRGFSNSEGKPSFKGIQQDSESILSYIFTRTDIDKNRVFTHGRSLGGATSTFAVYQNQNKNKIAGMILENTFTSISEVIKSILPVVWFIDKLLFSSLIRNPWRTIDLIPEIKVPILFISSLKDELIPYQQMEQLYQAANSSVLKQKLEMKNGDHNSNWVTDKKLYFDTVKNFIDDCLQQSPSL